MPTTNQLYEAGLALHKQGQLDAAAERYDSVLMRDKKHASALHMRGVIHLQQRNHAEAAKLIGQAVALQPHDATAHGNLVAALLPLNRFDEAIEVGRNAVQLNANSADIWGNLGTALSRRDRYPEASEAYRRAIALRPDRAGLHSALGRCLTVLKRYEEAMESHRRAIELAPDRAEYRHGMAMTLAEVGNTNEAEALLRGVAGKEDLDPEILASLGTLLQKRGKISDAIDVLQQVRAKVGPSDLDRKMMFIKNYVDSTTVETQLAQAIEAADRLRAGAVPYAGHDNTPDPERPIRVGLVSSDFRQHSVGMFLIDPLRAIDPKRLELYVYSGADVDDDAFNVEFRRYLRDWRSTYGVSDYGLAERVRQDRIDILVDLSGPTAGTRLATFAWKPAPIALGWLGYSGTTGLDTIDYILGDAEVLPEGLTQSSETPWRLPDAYLCFSPQAEAPDVGTLPALTNGSVVFGSLNNTSKLSAATLDAWAKILALVPDSRLHLKTRRKDHAADDTARLIGEFTSRGISANRVAVLDWTEGWLTHLPYYNGIDIGLDPFPYNGTTTTCESLHMGVPVLTLRGDRFISRVGATILKNAGLDDWIADDIDTYVAKAVAFASDLPALSHLRQTLRQQFVASPMCDAPRFARNFEAALRGMWRTWCDKQQRS